MQLNCYRHLSGQLLTINLKTFGPFLQTNRLAALIVHTGFLCQQFVLNWCQIFLLLWFWSVCVWATFQFMVHVTVDTQEIVLLSCPLASSQGLELIRAFCSHIHHVETERVSFLTNITTSVFVPLHNSVRHVCLEVAPKDERDFLKVLVFWSSQTKRTKLKLSPSAGMSTLSRLCVGRFIVTVKY